MWSANRCWSLYSSSCPSDIRTSTKLYLKFRVFRGISLCSWVNNSLNFRVFLNLKEAAFICKRLVLSDRIFWLIKPFRVLALIMSVWSLSGILIASVLLYRIYINTSTIYMHKTLHKCHCTRSWHLTQYFPYGLLRSIFANFMCARFQQKRTLSHIQVERICCRVSALLRMYVSPCSCWVCLYAILLRLFSRICACLCRIFPVVFNAHERACACVSARVIWKEDSQLIRD